MKGIKGRFSYSLLLILWLSVAAAIYGYRHTQAAGGVELRITAREIGEAVDAPALIDANGPTGFVVLSPLCSVFKEQSEGILRALDDLTRRSRNEPVILISTGAASGSVPDSIRLSLIRDLAATYSGHQVYVLSDSSVLTALNAEFVPSFYIAGTGRTELVWRGIPNHIQRFGAALR